MKSSEELKIELEAGASTTALVYEPDGPPGGASLILAHGAGAGQRSPFMVAFASALASRGITIITFNFLYTERHRKVPDRRPVLDACYVAAIAAVREQVTGARDALFIGGKSMGGRIATHVAAEDSALRVAGLVLLGYPLHPPGRPDQRRDAHLPAVRRPMLIVQGERDAFGTPPEFDAVLDALSPRPALHVVAGGYHSFKVARAGRSAQDAVHEDVQRTIVEWIGTVRQSARETRPPHH